ncbi:DUF2517 family protein, partial [Escherichia coli]|uniref:DUF2517 family protein n=1 Tax=Escherichia coli TaxID=562 RepID=UPI000F0AB5C5
MFFGKPRPRFYSTLPRVWKKTSKNRVWMNQAKKATGFFYCLPNMTLKKNRRWKRWRFSFFGVYTYSCKPFRSSNESTTF